MSGLYLYDDEKAQSFEPFALTRPVSEMMAGAEIIRRRWERAVDDHASGFIAPRHLANFDEPGAPRAMASDDVIPAGSLIANSRFVPSLKVNLRGAAAAEEFSAYHCGNELCAVRTTRDVSVTSLMDGSLHLSTLSHESKSCTTQGRWLNEIWDLIGQLVEQLIDDIPLLGSTLAAGAAEGATLIGKFAVFCEEGANIEPFVVLDASAGPILIRRGATISSFSRVVGPCYIGENATVVGDQVRACSIGEMCKVRGEISNSVMLGYSNKGHTGFVGHSYIGRWVNLGAGTTTSNLKNTYGSVQMWTPSGMRDTGAQFLGTLFGDHVKTGIGTLLTTGTVLGAGANIFGGSIRPKRVPAFAWGDDEPFDRYEKEKFTAVAQRMMARRHVELSDSGRKQLEDAYDASKGGKK